MTFPELIGLLQSASLYLQDLNLSAEVDAVSFAEEWLRANEEDVAEVLETKVEP